MNSYRCSNCGLVNFPTDTACKRCGSGLEPQRPAPDPEPAVVPLPAEVIKVETRSGFSPGDFINGVVWCCAVILIAGSYPDLQRGLEEANGAPQQAVAAAVIACRVIIFYCTARAVSAIVRSLQGK